MNLVQRIQFAAHRFGVFGGGVLKWTLGELSPASELLSVLWASWMLIVVEAVDVASPDVVMVKMSRTSYMLSQLRMLRRLQTSYLLRTLKIMKSLQSFEDVDVSSPVVEVFVNADVDFPDDVAFVVDVSPNVEVTVAAPEFFGGKVAEISLLTDDEMCSLGSLSEEWCRKRFPPFIWCTNAHSNRALQHISCGRPYALARALLDWYSSCTFGKTPSARIHVQMIYCLHKN